MKKMLSAMMALLLMMLPFVTAMAETVEAPGNGPADASAIASVADVPLLMLNNGLKVPQLGLGTQIQRLESDASQTGRELLNQTSYKAAMAALQAGYRHLDTAHGYYNERGVGQAMMTCFQAVAEESTALIIYFDYSENIDTTGMDVDAISQASMAGTLARDRGNLLVMKEILAERTGADTDQHMGAVSLSYDEQMLLWVFSKVKGE